MPTARRFIQCDVFSATPTRGNALAVVVDGGGLSDTQMQQFAAWTNLAETTFLLPPTDSSADYRVRIFTTTREMLFAGHPTLGSCISWLHCGGVPANPNRVRQECGVGIVEIDLSGEVPAFIAPPTDIQPLPGAAKQRIARQLNIVDEQIIDCARLDNGPLWQVFELDTAASVLAVDSSLVSWPEYKAVGLIGRHPAGNECDYEVRMLAPSSGMSEDPITGSLNSALAHWLINRNQLERDILIAQGTCLGRVGRVAIQPDLQHAGVVRIGGATNILIDGTAML